MSPSLRASSVSEQVERIIAEARSWVGTPWHHAARCKGAGVDCAQFLIAVFSAAGIVEAFDTEYYPIDWHLHRDEPRFLKYLLSHAVKVSDPLPGDVVMFRYGRQAAHGGIVIEWPLIVHAWLDEGAVCYTTVDNSPLRERVAGFYRVRALA